MDALDWDVFEFDLDDIPLVYTCKTIADKHNLDFNGFNDKSNYSWTFRDAVRVAVCRRYIANGSIKITKNWSINSSYSLKHQVEELTRPLFSGSYFYVSNGAFILAAIMEGLEYKRLNHSPNAIFRRS